MTPDDRDTRLPASEPRSAEPAWADIDALLDGEAVDRAALRTVLADSDARDYLLDALVLRQLARDAGPSHFAAPARPRHPAVRLMRRLAAVLVLTTGVAGGYFYGARHQPVALNEDVATPAVAEPALAESAPPAAPAPTQIIRFEPGVNWASSEGRR
jgi:hypothetical protein